MNNSTLSQSTTQPKHSSCIFCQMLKGEIPYHLIHETEQVFTILSLENHPLVIPKKHVPDIFEVDHQTSCVVTDEVKLIATATKKGMDADGIRISQLNGAAAGQEVFHYHVHVLPKWEDKMHYHPGVQDEGYKQKLVTQIKSGL